MTHKILIACVLVTLAGLALSFAVVVAQTADVKSRYDIAWASYVGGSGWDQAREVIPYPDGSVLVGAQTNSPDFPVTDRAVQKKFAGGAQDGVFAVLSGDGSKLLYATYLGGSGEEMIRSVAVTPKGEVFLVGQTGSADFPVTMGALQTRLRGSANCFVVKLTPAAAGTK